MQELYYNDSYVTPYRKIRNSDATYISSLQGQLQGYGTRCAWHQFVDCLYGTQKIEQVYNSEQIRRTKDTCREKDQSKYTSQQQ